MQLTRITFNKRSIIFLLVTYFLIGCSTPEEKAADYIESGYALLEKGDYVKSNLEFRNALQINANLVDAIYGLALIEENRKEWRKVLSLLTKIQELDPTHYEARIKLAQLYLASGQIDLALEEGKDLLKALPDDARSHALMAAVLYRLENYAGASEEINKALTIDSGNSDAKLVQASIYIKEKKYHEAISLLDEQIKNDRENSSLYLLKMQAYQKSGNQEGVENVYNDLISVFPDNKSFKQALAKLYLSNGNVDKSREMLKSLAMAGGSSVDDKLIYIEFIKKNDSVDEAFSILRDFVKAEPEVYELKFTEGKFLEKNGKVEEARQLYQNIIDKEGVKPAALTARNKLSILELRAGNKDIAKDLVTQVLSEDNQNENALFTRASFKYEQKDLDGVIIDLRTILRNNPESTRALSMLAKAHEMKGEDQLAIDFYMQAYQIKPEATANINNFAVLLIKRKQYDLAEEVLENSLRMGNRNIQSVKLLAQVKLSKKDWDGAEKLAKILEKTKSSESVSHQIMGIILQNKDKYSESVNAFQRAHQLAPSDTQPIIALVQTYIRAGKNEEAKKFLNSIISVHQDNFYAYALLGQIALLEDNVDEAESNFKKVTNIAADSIFGYRSLASLYFKKNRYEDAKDILQKGVKLSKNSSSLSLMLASIYEKQKNYDSAINVYNKLLEENPGLLIAKNNLASLLIDYKGDAESILRAKQISLDLKDSKIPHLRDTYAWATLKSGGNISEVIRLLEGVVKEAKNVAVFNYHLGDAYLAQGNKNKAAQYFENAIKYSGKDEELSKKARQGLQQINQ